ncbi:MAG: hypothetical protein KDB80_16935, partial [Planctomycetes bacterium]|nr:hypothetical protein [Planctomycetota bacterium]
VVASPSESRLDRTITSRATNRISICSQPPIRDTATVFRWILLGGAATSGFALAVVISRPHSISLLAPETFAALLAGSVVSCACSAAAVVDTWRRRRVEAWEWRAGFCAFVLTAVAYQVFAPTFKALFLSIHLGLACGVFATFLLLARRVRGRISARARNALDLGAFSLCVALVGTEATLRCVPLFTASPVFERTTTPRAQIDRYRLAPGQAHFGFPANRLGFPDVDPVRRAGRRFLIAIGDSFGQGVVPHAFHYTTVCEALLGDTDIANFGITTIGPAEYRTILEQDALPLAPDAVIVTLFVGNDVHDSLRYRDDFGWWRELFDRTRCQLYQVTCRLLRLGAEQTRTGHEAGHVQGELERDVVLERDAVVARYPWLEDHALEQPTFSREAYRDIEYTRIVAACGPDSVAAYDALFSILDAMVERATPTPIWFVLIPDEFQVEDDLWRDALAGREDPQRYGRLRPQERIRAWLDQRGIPYLDLLPVLREVRPLADGDRHLYHLRDTHFNARGNQVAGRALAEFLRDR